MITYDRELTDLRDQRVVNEALANHLIAVERREVFSIDDELRAVLYIAVAMITAGVGVLVAKHREQIGPIAIISAIAIAAAAAYAFPIRHRMASREPSVIDEYLLLLGSLLVSADVGFAEHQFHLLDKNWPRHFLLLAVIHAVVAYVFASRTVLSLSITSFAAWLGVEATVWNLVSPNVILGRQGLFASGGVLLWKIANHFRGRPEFDEVFDHFAAILGLAAGLSFVFSDEMHWIGVAVVAVYAIACIRVGLMSGREALVIYAVLASAAALDHVVWRLVHEPVFEALWIFMTSSGAVVLLFVIHQRMRGNE
jgi:hypothetical protein